jgi:acetoin utilization protein AcuB
MKTVKKHMKRNPVVILAETPLAEVWSLIFKKGIHALPVVDKGKKLAGIISEEDLLYLIYPKYTEMMMDINNFNLAALENQVKKLQKYRAKDVMNKMVFTTEPQASIFLALSRMLMLQVRQLPVIDEKNRVIGMITKGDLFDYIFHRYLIPS